MFGARSRTTSGRLSSEVKTAATPKLAASIAIA